MIRYNKCATATKTEKELWIIIRIFTVYLQFTDELIYYIIKIIYDKYMKKKGIWI